MSSKLTEEQLERKRLRERERRAAVRAAAQTQEAAAQAQREAAQAQQEAARVRKNAARRARRAAANAERRAAENAAVAQPPDAMVLHDNDNNEEPRTPRTDPSSSAKNAAMVLHYNDDDCEPPTPLPVSTIKKQRTDPSSLVKIQAMKEYALANQNHFFEKEKHDKNLAFEKEKHDKNLAFEREKYDKDLNLEREKIALEEKKIAFEKDKLAAERSDKFSFEYFKAIQDVGRPDFESMYSDGSPDALMHAGRSDGSPLYRGEMDHRAFSSVNDYGDNLLALTNQPHAEASDDDEGDDIGDDNKEEESRTASDLDACHRSPAKVKQALKPPLVAAHGQVLLASGNDEAGHRVLADFDTGTRGDDDNDDAPAPQGDPKHCLERIMKICQETVDSISSVHTGDNTTFLRCQGSVISFGENEDALVRTHKEGDDQENWKYKPGKVDFLNTKNPPAIVKMSVNSSAVALLDERGVVYFGGCFAVTGENETRRPDSDDITGYDKSARPISCTLNGTAEDAIVGGTVLCILQKNGDLLTCGINNYGQCGRSTENQQEELTPTRIDLPNKCEVDSMAAGLHHCVICSKSGAAYSFGRNDVGQLGLGFIDRAAHPRLTKIEGLSTHKVVQVAAFDDGSLFLTDTGDVHVCGRAEYGALGNGNPGATEPVCTPQCVPIPMESKIVRIGAQSTTCFAEDDRGRVYVWGANTDYKAGTTASETHWESLFTPTLMEIPPGHAFRDHSVAERHSITLFAKLKAKRKEGVWKCGSCTAENGDGVMKCQCCEAEFSPTNVEEAYDYSSNSFFKGNSPKAGTSCTTLVGDTELKAEHACGDAKKCSLDVSGRTGSAGQAPLGVTATGHTMEDAAVDIEHPATSSSVEIAPLRQGGFSYRIAGPSPSAPGSESMPSVASSAVSAAASSFFGAGPAPSLAELPGRELSTLSSPSAEVSCFSNQSQQHNQLHAETETVNETTEDTLVPESRADTEAEQPEASLAMVDGARAVSTRTDDVAMRASFSDDVASGEETATTTTATHSQQRQHPVQATPPRRSTRRSTSASLLSVERVTRSSSRRQHLVTRSSRRPGLRDA